jgi:hypothetical protein
MKKHILSAVTLSLMMASSAIAQQPQTPALQPTVQIKSNGIMINPFTRTLIMDLQIAPRLPLDNLDQYRRISIPKVTFVDLEASAFQLVTPDIGFQTTELGLELGSIIRKPFLTLNNTYDTFSSLAPGAVTFLHINQLKRANIAGEGGVQLFVKMKFMPVVSTMAQHGNSPHITREDEVADAFRDYCEKTPDCRIIEQTEAQDNAMFASAECGIRTDAVSISFDFDYLNIYNNRPGSFMLESAATGNKSKILKQQRMEMLSGTFNFDYTIHAKKDLSKFTVGAWLGFDATRRTTLGNNEIQLPNYTVDHPPGSPIDTVYPNQQTADEVAEIAKVTQSACGIDQVIQPTLGIRAAYALFSEEANFKARKRGFNTETGVYYGKSGENGTTISAIKKFFQFKWLTQPRKRKTFADPKQ